ncbi:Histidine kinase 1, partial [Pseudocercospora fuligena]
HLLTETSRYAEAVLNVHESSGDAAATSSIDVPLTAFAQLVALRLHAKRVLISLFDKNHQAAHELTKRPQSSNEDATLIIPDLLIDDRYSQHPLVAGEPFIRSYIGVPLLSPTGCAIGLLSVLDDQVRQNGVDKSCIKIMRDVSSSVITHLELARTKAVHSRAQRMVQGLSRFIEGKDSLVDDPCHEGQSAEQVSVRLDDQTSRLGASARTHALNAASNIERVDDARVIPRTRGYARSRSYETRQQSSVSPMPSTQAQLETTSRRTSAGPVPASRKLKESNSASQLQQDLVLENVSQAFQRAATLIQQAMDMAGVLVLDASAGEFGSLRTAGDTDPSPTNTDSGESSTLYNESARISNATTKRIPKHKPARCLAAAHGENIDLSSQMQPIPERFVRSLIRQFPHGKIFNFTEDGLLSSDHSDKSTTGSEGGSQRDDASVSAKSVRPKRRKGTASTDPADLANIIPGIRSFAMVPMWDSQKGRFLAVTVTWSYEPMRFFSFKDDLNYLGAFCDVVMTEIGRLEVQADAKSKSTFIASISHELRSPLHGILGGAEFLQEEDDDDHNLRQQMVQMIDSCGRSLLDIINNLLEHAHGSGDKDSGRSKARSRRRVSRQTSPTEIVQDLSILTEEVLHSMLHSTPKPANSPKSPTVEEPNIVSPLSEPIKVILDMDVNGLPPSGWNFHVNAGAYRRILQNLASNAMKYTESGFCKCRLSLAGPVADGKRFNVELECSDSGKGMSEEYLQHGLWQAFNQEDSHAQGTGLGLSLVHDLVKDLGGTIDVRSTQGVGTSIKVVLPLFAGAPTGRSLRETDDAIEVQGLTYSLVGFESSSEEGQSSTNGRDLLRASIGRTCQYLGLPAHNDGIDNGTDPQFVIVTERQALVASRLPKRQRPSWQRLPCIILCDSVTASRSAAPAIAGAFRQAITVSQPLGPRQLLKSLVLCLHTAPQERDLATLNINQDAKPSFSAAPTPASENSEMNWATQSVSQIIEPPTAGPPIAQHLADSTTSEMSIDDQLRRTSSPEFRRHSVRASASSVLVVDDNPVNLTLLERYMKKLKRTYVGAVNGQEALDAYKANHSAGSQPSYSSPTSSTSQIDSPTLPISVIFMDITMPVMDGLEASRRIRAYERAAGLQPVMIVALTALASPHARQEAYSSGIDLFLTKPVRYKDIEKMFEDWEAEIG